MNVDLVLIGRNEGARLVAALDAAQGQARQVVYVDSGSTDKSVEEARARGARVVELDMSIPFTAARARNSGFDALEAPEIVQFIDGDCMLVPGWIAKGAAHLSNNPHLGLVTGWRAEIHPEHSVYNRLCDWEWHRPAGPIRACGGDMMVRADIWAELGGMTETVIAAEDDEFCTRLHKAGWGLERLPEPMTRHDAAMRTFGQWWKRAERTGHGFAQVGHIHPDYFTSERRRVWIYGGALPLLLLVWPLTFPALALFALNAYRSAQNLARDGVEQRDLFAMGSLVMLSKIPNMLGYARFHLRRLTGRAMRIIEYK